MASLRSRATPEREGVRYALRGRGPDGRRRTRHARTLLGACRRALLELQGARVGSRLVLERQELAGLSAADAPRLASRWAVLQRAETGVVLRAESTVSPGRLAALRSAYQHAAAHVRAAAGAPLSNLALNP